MNNDEKTNSYEVGYGKPPKKGQFKKGVSGNPLGRPKKPADFESMLLRELDSRLTITENGKRRVITKRDALTKQLINKAISGHLPATRLLVVLHEQAVRKAEEERRKSERPVEELTDEELTALIRSHVGQDT